MDSRLQGGISYQAIFLFKFRRSVPALFSLVDLWDECKHCTLFQASKSYKIVGLRYFFRIWESKQGEHVLKLGKQHFRSRVFLEFGLKRKYLCCSLAISSFCHLVKRNAHVVECLLFKSVIHGEHCGHFGWQDSHKRGKQVKEADEAVLVYIQELEVFFDLLVTILSIKHKLATRKNN